MNPMEDKLRWLEKAGDADQEAPQELHGLLAEFETPEALLEACTKVRDAGYKKWDALTPFPVHGIDEAMGIRMTILPWLSLGAGITGLMIAFALQIFTNGIDYKFLISGKPFISVPANIPVAFELTVLLAAFTTFFGMMILNFLPELFHPLFRAKRFPRMTADRFGIYIESKDPLFNRQQAELMFSRLGASALEPVLSPTKRAPLPAVIHGVGLTLTLVALIPVALAVKSRVSKSDQPRIHIIQDMDFQEKYKTQTAHPLLYQGAASMQPVAGTIRRGDLREDDHLYRGMAADEFARGFPIALTQEVLLRGKQRYSIYCGVCHGATGYGDGLVAQRAEALAEGTWVPPLSLHEAVVLDQAEGQIFNTITHGIRTMKPYGSQIDVQDRWAIVAYVRALQRSQRATLTDVPPEVRAQLSQ